MNLDTNRHSVFKLYYHLILVVKYRRKVIDDYISETLKKYFLNIEDDFQIKLEEWNHDIDHVHILFTAEPTTNLSKFINAYKSASSRMIKSAFPSIKKKLWEEAFWSKSYCLLSSGGATIEVIREYIKSQGENGEEN